MGTRFRGVVIVPSGIHEVNHANGINLGRENGDVCTAEWNSAKRRRKTC